MHLILSLVSPSNFSKAFTAMYPGKLCSQSCMVGLRWWAVQTSEWASGVFFRILIAPDTFSRPCISQAHFPMCCVSYQFNLMHVKQIRAGAVSSSLACELKHHQAGLTTWVEEARRSDAKWYTWRESRLAFMLPVSGSAYKVGKFQHADTQVLS
jgi:hypothetical protein